MTESTAAPTKDALTRALFDGIADYLKDLQRIGRPGHLAAFALCTDDCLMTVFGTACTDTAIAASRRPDTLYLPVEWPRLVEHDHFARAYEIIVARYDALRATHFDEHVEQSFACLVEALRRARTEGLVGPDVVLIATSTDPSEDMVARAHAAARALNPTDVYERFRAVNGD